MLYYYYVILCYDYVIKRKK